MPLPQTNAATPVPATSGFMTVANAWNVWNQQYVTTTNTVWPVWNQMYIATATTNTSNGIIWQNWQTAGATQIMQFEPVWQQWNQTADLQTWTIEACPVMPVLTPEEIAAREAARAAAIERNRERRADEERDLADTRERAKALLLSVLTDEQRDEYEQKLHFHLLVGDKTYRVYRGTHGNVKLLEGDVEVEGYCIQPPIYDLPDEDAMVAQILMLQHEPEKFLKIANSRALRDRHFVDGRQIA